jgi:hypothetical protein
MHPMAIQWVYGLGMNIRPTRKPRFTQNMPPELVDRIDAYATRHGIARNAAINILCTISLDIAERLHRNERSDV